MRFKLSEILQIIIQGLNVGWIGSFYHFLVNLFVETAIFNPKIMLCPILKQGIAFIAANR